MSRQLGDLTTPAHRIWLLTRGQKLAALGELADDLFRRHRFLDVVSLPARPSGQ